MQVVVQRAQLFVTPRFDLPVRENLVAVIGAAQVADDFALRRVPIVFNAPVVAAQAILARRFHAGRLAHRAGRALVDALGQEAERPAVQRRGAAGAKRADDLLAGHGRHGGELAHLEPLDQPGNHLAVDDLQVAVFVQPDLPAGGTQLVEVAARAIQPRQFFVAARAILGRDEHDARGLRGFRARLRGVGSQCRTNGERKCGQQQGRQARRAHRQLLSVKTSNPPKRMIRHGRQNATGGRGAERRRNQSPTRRG